MDVGQVPRPVSVPVPAGAGATQLRSPQTTELPPVQAVMGTPDAGQVTVTDYDDAGRRARNLETVQSKLKQKLSIDDESGLVISSTVSQAGAVIEQYPNEWQVKQRIYARAELERELAAQAEADAAGDFAPKFSASA
jgi:hypothetical protein